MEDDKNRKTPKPRGKWARAWDHPYTAWIASSVGNEAKLKAQNSKFPGSAEGQQDAYRHILWMAETRRQLGETYPNDNPNELDQAVREMGLAYEEQAELDKTQTPQNKAMDLYNNDLGVKLGREAVGKKDAPTLEKETLDFVKNNDGTGKNNTPFWYEDDYYIGAAVRKPPLPLSEQNPTPPNLRDELKKNYQDMQKQSGQPQDPQPNPNETDPETGKRFKDMKTGEYTAAYYRWQKRQAANDSHANDNGKAASGTVHVHAYSRDGGKTTVHAYDRKPPQP